MPATNQELIELQRKMEISRDIDFTQFIDIKVAMTNARCNGLVKLLHHRKEVINSYFNTNSHESKVEYLRMFGIINLSIKEFLAI